MARRAAGLIAVAFLAAACGSSNPPVVLLTSPSPASASPTSPSAGSAPSPTPSPASAATRLVIQDYFRNQVRLAKFNAVDTAVVSGSFEEVVGGKAIILAGQKLLAVTAQGSVDTLGVLALNPNTAETAFVAVNPSLTEWAYSEVDSNLTSRIYVGSSGAEKLVSTIPSVDQTEYQAFAWNPSGVYLVKQATGLGGAGPYLEYRFPLVRLDPTTGQITQVSPACVAEGVLDDGTLLCKTTTGGLEVRATNGSSHVIQVAAATSGGNGVFTHLTLSPDHQRMVAVRNGNSNPDLVNYQMVTAAISGTTVTPYGLADFYPGGWLPDGRVVAKHLCYTFQQNSGPCDKSLDGTYFVSADGASRTLFYKLLENSDVVAAV